MKIETGTQFFQQCVAYQQQAQMLTNETDKLRSDNVKLYEKIKFLQAYPTKVRVYKSCELGTKFGDFLSALIITIIFFSL